MKIKNFRTDYLPFGSLEFDDTYQRQMIPARVAKLMEDWSLSDVGAITVSIRDRKPYVIDGQHRVRAALELGLADTKVLCHVYTNLTMEQEAAKFLALNDAKSVSPLDRFRAGVVAGDPTAVGVQAILAERGLAIGSTGNTGAIQCVGKVVKLYEQDPALLEETVDVLRGAWGNRDSAFEQVVLSATGMVLNRYNGELDRKVLVRKLAKYPGGPAALIGDARGLTDFRPMTVTRAAATIIVDQYNAKKRTGVLEPL